MNIKPLDILHKYYGYTSFRKGQENIITSIINKEDVLAIMPTGGGKSICYQVPALCLDGITIVISPLISLMKDQVDALKTMGVKARLINSSLSNSEYNEALEEIFNVLSKCNKYIDDTTPWLLAKDEAKIDRLKKIREVVGKDSFIISPGVGFQGGNAKDTLQYSNAAIVGRSIYNASNPKKALEEIIESIKV